VIDLLPNARGFAKPELQIASFPVTPATSGPTAQEAERPDPSSALGLYRRLSISAWLHRRIRAACSTTVVSHR